MQKLVLTIECLVLVLVWIEVWEHSLRVLNRQWRKRVLILGSVDNSRP